MAKAKTTIELNGKLYDARTGKVITDAAPAPVVHATTPTKSTGTVVDGFVRRPHAEQTVQPVAVTKPKPAAPRTAPAHAQAKLQKSRTLMRPAVKKPKTEIKTDIVPAKYSNFKKENHVRAERAVAVPRSSAVSRFHFSPSPDHKIVKKSAALPVAAPAADALTQQISQQVAHLATSTEAHVKHSVDIIEEGLRNATAHLEKFEDTVRTSVWERFGWKHKGSNIASVTFAALLLVGFFAYQNAPNLEMRLAATKSGIAASMPGYKPAGFSASNVDSGPGKVSVTFRSNSDDKNFTVHEQASSWSSDALLNNHVATTKQPYQTFQDQGRTVFIYDNSNATWVDGGIWYRVEGNASLTSDQLLRIANSL